MLKASPFPSSEHCKARCKACPPSQAGLTVGGQQHHVLKALLRKVLARNVLVARHHAADREARRETHAEAAAERLYAEAAAERLYAEAAAERAEAAAERLYAEVAAARSAEQYIPAPAAASSSQPASGTPLPTWRTSPPAIPPPNALHPGMPHPRHASPRQPHPPPRPTLPPTNDSPQGRRLAPGHGPQLVQVVNPRKLAVGGDPQRQVALPEVQGIVQDDNICLLGSECSMGAQ